MTRATPSSSSPSRLDRAASDSKTPTKRHGFERYSSSDFTVLTKGLVGARRSIRSTSRSGARSSKDFLGLRSFDPGCAENVHPLFSRETSSFCELWRARRALRRTEGFSPSILVTPPARLAQCTVDELGAHSGAHPYLALGSAGTRPLAEERTEYPDVRKRLEPLDRILDRRRARTEDTGCSHAKFVRELRARKRLRRTALRDVNRFFVGSAVGESDAKRLDLCRARARALGDRHLSKQALHVVLRDARVRERVDADSAVEQCDGRCVLHRELRLEARCRT